jgi:hypothetical protein
MTPSARLALSEKVISGWEAMGRPTGRVEDNMRMVREELEALRKIAADAPDLAERVAAVSERYGRMALKIKLSMN